MNEFILGFISAVVIMLVLLPILSKFIMKYFMKRSMGKLANNVMYKFNKFATQFNQISNGEEEDQSARERV